MTDPEVAPRRQIDRVNVLLGGLVFLGAYIVYALTVQRSISFWDCGELVACAVIGGIPHPPGFPLLVMISHIFSKIPFVEDISYRVNYVSVISSAFTALFSYLIAVRLIRYLQGDGGNGLLNRLTAYAGGVAGGFFVAFSATNWGNSVEAETYALALALSTAVFWLTLLYHERRAEPGASKLMLLAIYLAVLGIGVHMTVFLVVPVCAIFFVLNNDARPRDYALICLFALVELLLVIIFSNGRGGPTAFKYISVVLGLILLLMLYRRIRWGILVAIAATCSLMVDFSLYFRVLPVAVPLLVVSAFVADRRTMDKSRWGTLFAILAGMLIIIGLLFLYPETLLWSLPVGVLLLIALAFFAVRDATNLQWRSALLILLVGFMGFSVHYFVPIRSSLNPRIDENNPSRDWQTFVDFLDRKQYGQASMVDRMFVRRGEWSNQFGRHPNMGFWSYFEEQYGGSGGWGFAPFFVLGMLGAIVAIRKRLEIGLPFLTLIFLASVGLILYMNFADGIHYDALRGEAYLEVRNRDYFFTPAFVFFGIAMGVGVAALINIVREALAESSLQRPAVFASSLLALLPVISLKSNYHACDRSKNFLPMAYARNLLDGCPENTILFTVGDNDTFPTWCLQEAYDYRKDIRIVNLSLLNTDWYVEQMKTRYGVPISLTEDQIRWYPYELPDGQITHRPLKPFADRPRRRMTYMHPQFSGIATQDMMVDEIVIENRWRFPLYFSAPPYADSPLNLRAHAVHDGQLYRLEKEPESLLVDLDHSYELFMNVYQFTGLENSQVFRDENATAVFAGLGMASVQVVDEMLRQGDRQRAEDIMYHLIDVMPEFWQPYTTLADLALRDGDTVKAVALYQQLNDTLTAYLETNPKNQYYLQDLGTARYEMGELTNSAELKQQGLQLLREGWAIDMNDGLSFRKIVTVLGRAELRGELYQVARQYARYGRNRTDPLLQNILGLSSP